MKRLTMKKLFFTLIILTVFPVQSKHNCTARYRKNFKTGVLHSHNDFIVKDCNCPCTGPRTEKNVCLQCGHTHRPEKIKTRPISLVQDTEDTFEEMYDFTVDLVTTDTSTKRKKY